MRSVLCLQKALSASAHGQSETTPTQGCITMDGVGSTWNFSSEGFCFLKGGRKPALQLRAMMGKEVRRLQARGESLKQLRTGE